LSEISGDNSIGLIAPQLENPDGSIQSNGLKIPSVSNKLKRFAKKILHIPLQSEYIDAINSNKKYFPDYLIGAAQLFRKDIIKLTGLLDEKIFYGPEDADFCLRIKEQGYKIVCLPSVRMTHSYQRRSYKISQIPILLKHLKALFYFWNKHKKNF
jgi:GT2 family glycosyltransferase